MSSFSDDQNLPPLRIGISSCLLGEAVRFDGGHKRDRYIVDTLSEYFEWVRVCPEVELGLGTPRETIQLVQLAGDTRLQTTRTHVDLTEDMSGFSERRVGQLAKLDLDGYILKKGSPSCGMERVKVHQAKGAPRKNGQGLFAAALMQRLPELPVEEEGRLCDPKLRENWVERVFAYHALKSLWKPRWRISHLVAFHTRYKFLLLSHSEQEYRKMGPLVAQAKSIPRDELKDQYQHLFMQAMRRISTVKKNVNVLQHMLGFFRKQLDAATRAELMMHITDYHQGVVPLIVPIMMIRHFVRMLNVEYLRDQVYLNPHPKELALRNHV